MTVRTGTLLYTLLVWLEARKEHSWTAKEIGLGTHTNAGSVRKILRRGVASAVIANPTRGLYQAPSGLAPEHRSACAVSRAKIRSPLSQRGGRALPPIVRNRDGAVLDGAHALPPPQPLTHDAIRVEGEADHDHAPRARQGPRGAPRGVPPSLHPPAHLDRALRLHGRLAPRRLRAPYGAMAPPPS